MSPVPGVPLASTVERLEMFGGPDQRVRSAMSPVDTSDVSQRIFPRLIGFLRPMPTAAR